MMFVDASAMIAMIAGEPGADELADRLENEDERLCSAVSVWETVAGLCKRYAFSVQSAGSAVRSFMALSDIRFVAIGERETEAALDAYAQFGKGRHPAALNMGDCFAHACAKLNKARLLVKADDNIRKGLTPP